MNHDFANILKRQKDYFATGITLDKTFRKRALTALRTAIYIHERELLEALWLDLHKSEDESFLTEISIVYGEIDYALNHLSRMMRRRRVAPELKVLPSRSYVLCEPLGSVLIMSPWNYPVNLLLCPLVGAIAAGCTALLKASDNTPNVNSVVAQLVTEAFAPEYVSFVEGGREVNSALLELKFDMIFFTGSPALGRVVMQAAARNLTPCVLELGGKSPCIVDKSADIPLAARRIMWGKCINAGQTCIAPDYLFVHKDVKWKLYEEMRRYVTDHFGKEPQRSPFFGRIISDRAMQRLIPLLKTSGNVVFGGGYDVQSRFIEPTLIDGVAESDAVMQQEIFGPIFPAMEFDNIDEVERYIKNHEKPLATYYFGDENEGWRLLRRVSSGGACINDVLMHISNSNLPFGGVGNSGFGKYHRRESFMAFSNPKAVLASPLWFDFMIKYPPFKGLRKLKRFI